MSGKSMEKPNQQLRELAYKWQKGMLTPEEKVRFEEWYHSFNDEELLMSESKYSHAEQIKASIKAGIDQQIAITNKPKTMRLWPRIVAAAAVILIIAGVALFKTPIQNLIDPVQNIQMATLAGQHRQIQLADGTKVWLSPATQINYPDEFRGKERTIEITGEAFFDVKHDPEHPFVIKSGALRTIVLGTSFNVQAYANSPMTEVTVVSGKVGVTADQKTEIMTANQRAVFNKTSQRLIKENYTDAQKFINQRIGIFNYNGASLIQVCKELEVQYGVQLKLPAELANKAFYGQLKTSIPIGQTLDKLTAVMEIGWRKEGNLYILQAKTPIN